jgi:hypothetical protein
VIDDLRVIGGLSVLVLFCVLLWFSLDLGSGLRRRALAALGARREWTLTPREPGVQTTFRGPPFWVGRQRTCTNVVRGRYEGHEFTACDYEYVTGPRSGDADQDDGVTRLQVLALALARPHRPAGTVQVAPRSRVGRLVEGDVGIVVRVGDDRFDDRFEVRATTEDLARRVLHPEVRARLLTMTDRAWRLQDGWLVAVARGRLRARELDGAVAAAHDLLRECRCEDPEPD